VQYNGGRGYTHHTLNFFSQQNAYCPQMMT
jgi:hypothetical protein